MAFRERPKARVRHSLLRSAPRTLTTSRPPFTNMKATTGWDGSLEMEGAPTDRSKSLTRHGGTLSGTIDRSAETMLTAAASNTPSPSCGLTYTITIIEPLRAAIGRPAPVCGTPDRLGAQKYAKPTSTGPRSAITLREPVRKDSLRFELPTAPWHRPFSFLRNLAK